MQLGKTLKQVQGDDFVQGDGFSAQFFATFLKRIELHPKFVHNIPMKDIEKSKSEEIENNNDLQAALEAKKRQRKKDILIGVKLRKI
ncbi:MAG: hypothetical protein A2Y25_07090 [Candidatus Melainabacteria bacterium GWF2_37_15]|nr:MAG: hypothetical protein A2Y25_07090 [Candidatus Melainabacteria bacterium GWF2_37_15]